MIDDDDSDDDYGNDDNCGDNNDDGDDNNIDGEYYGWLNLKAIQPGSQDHKYM